MQFEIILLCVIKTDLKYEYKNIQFQNNITNNLPTVGYVKNRNKKSEYGFIGKGV